MVVILVRTSSKSTGLSREWGARLIQVAVGEHRLLAQGRGQDALGSKGWQDAMVAVAPDVERDQLRRELVRLRAENARLARLLELQGKDTSPAAEQMSFPIAPGMVTMASPVESKLALYADRFCARTDAYAVLWENQRAGTSSTAHRRFAAPTHAGISAAASRISDKVPVVWEDQFVWEDQCVRAIRVTAHRASLQQCLRMCG